MFSTHAFPLAPGACGLVPLGVPHAWLGPKQGRAKWLDMLVPQPRGPDEPADTFFLGRPEPGEIKELDIRDPRSRHFFRLRDTDMQVDKLSGRAGRRPDGVGEHGDGAARL